VYVERLRHASIFHDVVTIVPHPIGSAAGDDMVVGRWGSVRLLAQPLEHGVECFGYRLREDDGRRMLPERLEGLGVRGPAVGELQRKGVVDVPGRAVRLEEVSEPRPGQSFALVMDTRRCEGARRLAAGADLLACESTYLQSEAREAHDHYHMTAAQAAELARDAGVRRLVLTHFSQRYTETEPFGVEARAFHSDVVVAADLTRVPVPRRQ
jgi:ribonuclease Z